MQVLVPIVCESRPRVTLLLHLYSIAPATLVLMKKLEVHDHATSAPYDHDKTPEISNRPTHL
jgi:hypothetical protein